MNTLHRFSWIALTLFSCTALLACGGGDEVPPTSDTAATPDQSTTPEDLVTVNDEGTPAVPDLVANTDTNGSVNCVEPGSLGELEDCCDFGPASCVPMDLIPEDFQGQVDACGDAGACVPEEILDVLRDGGTYSPAVCSSINGAEGRCLSVCLTEVAKLIQIVPQDVCVSHERCVPCVDPITGVDSGICDGGGLTCE